VFEVLRQCIDDSDSLEGLLLVCLAGDALVEGEPKRSFFAYQALRERLETDVRAAAHDNPLAPLVRLGSSATAPVPDNGREMINSGERIAIEALRAGVPNRVATRRLGSEEHGIENEFVGKLKTIREGADRARPTQGMLIAGEFGSGKSHLLGYLGEQAILHDFVVSFVPISKETPLFNPERMFLAAIRNAVVPEANDDVMRVVVERLLNQPTERQRLEASVSAPESGFAPLFAALLHLLPKNVVDPDDRAAIARFLGGGKLGIPRVRGWLREAGSSKLFDLGHVRAGELAEQRIRFAPLLFRAAGFAGWCLLLDEVELVARYSALQRGRSYAELTRWLGLEDGRTLPHTIAVGAMTPTFKDEVFERRLDDEKVPALLDARDMPDAARAAVTAMRTIQHGMRELQRPDSARLAESQRGIRWLYGESYGWKPELAEIGEQRGSKSMRAFIKSWVTGWDILRLYGTVDLISTEERHEEDLSENPDMERPSSSDGDDDDA
jgi:hypothetical protein